MYPKQDKQGNILLIFLALPTVRSGEFCHKNTIIFRISVNISQTKLLPKKCGLRMFYGFGTL